MLEDVGPIGRGKMPNLKFHRVSPGRMRRVNQLLGPLHAPVMVHADFGDNEHRLPRADSPCSGMNQGGMGRDNMTPAHGGAIPDATQN